MKVTFTHNIHVPIKDNWPRSIYLHKTDSTEEKPILAVGYQHHGIHLLDASMLFDALTHCESNAVVDVTLDIVLGELLKGETVEKWVPVQLQIEQGMLLVNIKSGDKRTFVTHFMDLFASLHQFRADIDRFNNFNHDIFGV